LAPERAVDVVLAPAGGDVPDGGPAALVVEGVPDGLPEDVDPEEPEEPGGPVGVTAAVVVTTVLAEVVVVTGYATLTPQVASASKAPIGLLNSMHCWVKRAMTPYPGSARAGRPHERGGLSRPGERPGNRAGEAQRRGDRGLTEKVVNAASLGYAAEVGLAHGLLVAYACRVIRAGPSNEVREEAVVLKARPRVVSSAKVRPRSF